MKYGRDFYAEKAALTRNKYGNGEAYYLAANAEQEMFDEWISIVADSCGIAPILKTPVRGVDIQSRRKGKNRYIFAENFSESAVLIEVNGDSEIVYGEKDFLLKPYEIMIIKQVI